MGKKFTLNKELIHEFVFFQYKPIRIKDLIKSMLLLAIVCVGAYLLNRGSWLAAFSVALGSISLLICLITFVFLPAPAKRFVVDGVLSSYIAVIFNLGAGQIIGSGLNKNITGVFFFLLVLCAGAFVQIIIVNIKNEKYKKMPSRTFILPPILCAVVGRAIGAAFIPQLPSDTVALIMGYLLLLLSLLSSAGIGFFLRLYYYYRNKDLWNGIADVPLCSDKTPE